MAFVSLSVDLHSPTVKYLMERLVLTLGFSQTVARELEEDQGIDSSHTLASLSDEYIATIHDMILSLLFQ